MNSPMHDAAIDPDDAWTAVLARDRAFDGRFVTGVLTTGIYCRPSCAARHPARGNVRAVLAAIQAIKAAEQPLALAALAQETGYSPAHFQRVFTRHTGLSPAAYARALMTERAAQALTDEGQVTQAIYAAGYSGPSRFYEATQGRLGMAPSAWANGGSGVTIHWAVVATSLGRMLVAATAKGVCRLSFDEGREALEARFPKAELVESGAEFEKLLAEVIAAVEAPGDFAHIPIDVKGTAFQEAVWRELRRIPKGETRTYAQLAAAVGKPKAVRAAGSANGANNVAVLIPCHRVIRTGGGLGGYAYGLEIKRKLLEKEAK
jgi:AraC family transcriptional regulator of adaptative response/methylated-DNA-[protein]-cysteine methyltransferase